MAAAQQVANAFTIDFVEHVAKNQANLAELYGRSATLTMNDFELGISEVADSDVAIAAQKWAASLQGSRLRVDSVNAAPIYGGVNVFLTLTAFGDLQQYFHIATTLESYPGTLGMDGFYIRHQVIARIGAVVPEPVAAPEPTPAPEEAAPAAPTPAAEPVAATPTPEPQPEAVPEAADEAVAAPAAEAPAAAAEEPAQEAAPAPAQQPAAPAAPAKPKSWAALVSSAPTKAAARPIRVVAHEAPEKKAAAPAAAAAAAKKEAAAPKEAAAAKRPPPRERKAPEPVGDRLMFNINGAVTDDEIRAGLGASAAHLVSLRNNSAKGLVFMDFAENVAVLDELVKAQPVIGAAKLKVTVFRQRPRE